MSPLSHRALEMQQPPSRWDYVLEGLVTVLLAFLPFAFGGRDEIGPDPTITLISGWSHEIFVALAALMALVLAARQLFQRDSRFVWSWAYLPIVLFILLAVLQLAQLPDRLVNAISPQTLRTKSRLLSDLPNAPSLLHSLTLTFYAQATRLDLRKLLAVSTVFVVVVNVYRRSWQIKRLLLTIGIIGVAIAGLALWQNAFGGRMIYGLVPAIHLNSGPFLNHSHFGQFMNLSIGAMLGLLLVRINEITEGSETFDDSVQLLRHARLNSVFTLGVMILLSASTVFFSLTRGGVVSMLIAASVVAVLYALRRGRGSFGSVMFVLAALFLLLVLYAGFGLVFERLASLRGVAENNGDRMQVLRDLSQAWRQFPVWGTGLGTHRYIFPMYDRSTVYSLAAYAENEYAQLMEEAGGLGLALCLSFIAIIVASFFRCIWHPRRPIHYAAYGLGYGLLAILIHSASDFGQHDPANACLTATFAGLLIVLARHARPLTARQQSRPAPLRRPGFARVGIGVAALAAAAAVFVAPLRAADAWRRARAQWATASRIQVHLNATGWDTGTAGNYERLLDSSREAVSLEPDNAVMRYWMAEFAWQDASVHQSAKAPLQLDHVKRIVDELNRARIDCPTYAPVYALAGQLDYLVLKRPEGQTLIRDAYQLDHNEPVSCEAVAQLDAVDGNWAGFAEHARRALTLDRFAALPVVLGICVSRGQPQMAHELAKGDLSALQMLCDLLRPDPKQKARVEQYQAESNELLLQEASAEGASADILAGAAGVYEQRGDPSMAVEYYGRALAKNYDRLDWRLKLADVLKNSGKIEQAKWQLNECLRLRPNLPEATTKLDELTALRGTSRADK